MQEKVAVFPGSFDPFTVGHESIHKPKSITSRQNQNYFTMKLKTLFAVFFAVFALNAVAQDLKFGVKGGLNLAHFGGDDNVMVNETKVGLHIGCFAQYGIMENLVLQPELLLSFEGSKVDDQDKTPFSLTYLNVPVMVSCSIVAVKGLSVEAGPQLGFLLGAKIDGDSERNTPFGSFKVKDNYKSTNFSFNLGAGYEITENIGIGLRYCIGLSSIADDSDSNLKQHNFQVSVAYKF